MGGGWKKPESTDSKCLKGGSGNIAVASQLTIVIKINHTDKITTMLV